VTVKPLPEDAAFIRRALTLAAKGFGRTHPNPCVGAVLVRGKKILGEGWHRRTGSAHAEILALRHAARQGHSVRGATLYVTLEPCCTHGRTPPCTEAIIAAGLKRVVVAATDPNPAHAGRAFRLLHKKGIAVTTGVLAREAAHLNRSFNHWITTGRPWVVGKAALSLDGKLTRPDKKQWLTSPQALRDAHRLRATCDAILVGAETARRDNPRLTVRGLASPLTPSSRQPLRVIVTRSGKLPQNLHLRSDTHRDLTLIYQKKSWAHVLKDLGQRGVTRLLVEGGGKVLNDLARKGLIHESVIYYAPLHFGQDPTLVSADTFRSLPLKSPLLTALGPDLKMEGLVTDQKNRKRSWPRKSTKGSK